MRAQALSLGLLGREGFCDVFLVGFDPVGGYLALSGLEVQLAGAYELVEFPLERIFDIQVPRRCLAHWGRRLRMELDPPKDSGIK